MAASRRQDIRTPKTTPTPAAVIDSNLLVKGMARYLILNGQRSGLYDAHVSDQILGETFKNQQRIIKLFGATKAMSDIYIFLPGENIVDLSGFEEEIDAIGLSDAKDNHVLFLAVYVVQAQYLVTNNIKHFKQDFIDELYGASTLVADIVWAVTLDEFLCEMYNRNPRLTVKTVIDTFTPMKRTKPKDCLNKLVENCDCPLFRRKLARHALQISLAVAKGRQKAEKMLPH